MAERFARMTRIVGEDAMVALIMAYVNAKGSVNYTGQGRIVTGE